MNALQYKTFYERIVQQFKFVSDTPQEQADEIMGLITLKIGSEDAYTSQQQNAHSRVLAQVNQSFEQQISPTNEKSDALQAVGGDNALWEAAQLRCELALRDCQIRQLEKVLGASIGDDVVALTADAVARGQLMESEVPRVAHSSSSFAFKIVEIEAEKLAQTVDKWACTTETAILRLQSRIQKIDIEIQRALPKIRFADTIRVLRKQVAEQQELNQQLELRLADCRKQVLRFRRPVQNQSSASLEAQNKRLIEEVNNLRQSMQHQAMQRQYFNDSNMKQYIAENRQLKMQIEAVSKAGISVQQALLQHDVLKLLRAHVGVDSDVDLLAAIKQPH